MKTQFYIVKGDNFIISLLLFVVIGFCSCTKTDTAQIYPDVKRVDKLPPDILKRGPAGDLYPPIFMLLIKNERYSLTALSLNL